MSSHQFSIRQLLGQESEGLSEEDVTDNQHENQSEGCFKPAQPPSFCSKSFPSTSSPSIASQIKTRRKQRTSFTERQLTALETMFRYKMYVTLIDRAVLAKHLELTDGQIKTWFQNRRTKWKRDNKQELLFGSHPLIHDILFNNHSLVTGKDLRDFQVQYH
ncbi:hypothetical protein ACHWQZ_G002947 [Mnemiopsis leidyi]